MNERRLKRRFLNGIVEVYDALRDAYIGRLVNIHSEGLMLMGDNRVEADRLYQLDLYLPESVNGRSVIHLGVDCLWARESDDSTKHWSGFHIIDKSAEATADIDVLVEMLGE